MANLKERFSRLPDREQQIIRRAASQSGLTVEKLLDSAPPAAARIGMEPLQFIRLVVPRRKMLVVDNTGEQAIREHWKRLCPKCGGTGILGTNFTDPPSEIEWCDCERGQERQKIAIVENRQRTKARIEAQFQGAGIPPRFEKLTLDTFPDIRAKKEALQAARQYYSHGYATSKNGQKKNSILFYGDVGVGKTGLVTPIAQQWLRRGDTVLYIEYLHFMADIQGCYNTDRSWTDLMRTAQQVDLLVLDDMGRINYRQEQETDDKREKLYLLLSYRHSHTLPTLITSNLNLNNIKLYFEPRIEGRIREMAAVIHVGGRDLRPEA